MKWDYLTPGIPDDLFERREDVPITKEDIRALVISKLRLRDDHQVIDVGCGSGGITVEVCLQTTNGKVYAIDLNPEAIELTQRNLMKFGVKAELILSNAQDTLPSLPLVDAIVIGGTNGEPEEIIRLCTQHLRSKGRIVIDTILIETVFKVLTAIKNEKLTDIEITQVTISKSKTVSTGTMLIARNPVTIISATKI